MQNSQIIILRYITSPDWTTLIVNNIDEFLPDHAAAEKKASGMAVSLISHYPDKAKLVLAMADLAVEELNHYRDVIKIIYERGLELKADRKDVYIEQVRKLIRNKNAQLNYDNYMLDRLLVAGIIEARGAERFGLIADALTDSKLKRFYSIITESEKRHNNVFVDLAKYYFNQQLVHHRLDELLDREAEITSQLPFEVALH